MSAPWFHVDAITDGREAGGRVALDALEVRHASGARRLRDGDHIVLFDGQGWVAEATLCDRGSAAAIEAVRSVPIPRPRVAIAAALPKGDRSAVMIDMATQLGMSAFVPLRCERGVVEATPNLLQRLKRVAVEACKQSRRAHVPRIEGAATIDEVLAGAGSATAVLVADPMGAAAEAARGADSDCVVLVGPEGGFSDGERQRMLRAGARLVSLSDGILRVETAVVAAVVRVQASPRGAGR